MKAHLCTMRREARSQAKECSQPETPRKAHSRAVQAVVKEMHEKLCTKRHLKGKPKSSKKSKTSKGNKSRHRQSHPPMDMPTTLPRFLSFTSRNPPVGGGRQNLQ
mmetsp:Transcript_3786/g.5638  ORF Transcript_3786/g.5638 Transcript_3786/m.5638 type:complete len:105 (+) Transcript_3786:326-640(+)